MKTSLLYPVNSTSRRFSSLDGMWRFQFDPESAGAGAGWANGLPDSISMPVPASFCDFFTDKDSREYTGDFWYETDFFVPGEWQGCELNIRFGSVTHRARVFVNGAEVVSHEGGFLPFLAPVTDVVNYNGMNKLVVLANNELNEYMLPAGTTGVLSNGKKMSAPYFDFYNYAGIHRPVKLVVTPKESIVDYTVSYRLDGADACVDYTVETNGDSPVAVELYDAEGAKVAEGCGASGTLLVKDAHLWNVHASYLYKIVIRILDGDKVVDEYYEKIGIRTFEVKNQRFLLNGKSVYLRGFGKHEDADIRGRGLDLATVKRDFECMKWIGANCFRTSHYPYADEVYQMADEEGFLIIDEVPAVGFMESTMNFLAANQGNGKKLGWFEKETTPKLLANHKQALREMITRDKNHASVVAWSILNEPQCTSEGTEAYFKEVFDYAHELDVQKRPRTYAIVMMSLPNTSKGWQFSDFLSLNRYYGWYVMGGYQMSDAEVAFHQELDGWQALAGDRPLIFTEYGADTMPSEHKLPSVMWSQEYQDEYLAMNHRVFDSYDFIQGELVWNFADFQTTEGIMRANGNKKGIFTRQRQPKDAAFAFKARWESLPLDYKG
ncbi:MAG: beta-glucuronidase [Clostridiales bacterium]|nr:beta-glucuronidase [Clostridiales bacterium]